MADDEDYLSDKFLAFAESALSQPTTYAERRKTAQRKSQVKNEQNKLKSRKARQIESREEGLGKSLIQRAQEEAVETGKENKALAMMMKMGFQPGESLGSGDTPTPPSLADPKKSLSPRPSAYYPQHRVEPLPIKEWTGKTGIGGIKRPPSPSILERASKHAKQAEELSADEFRDRARQEYEERRAEGRLRHAQTTCITLDAKEGVRFNRYWLDPMNPDTFPAGLLSALEDYWIPSSVPPDSEELGGSLAVRLKSQLQADALQPLSSEVKIAASLQEAQLWSAETTAEVMTFLRLKAPDRLSTVLGYLRQRYNYCFWCGSQYSNTQEINEQCPGPNEEDHD